MSSDEAYQEQLDKWAEQLAEFATGLIPDIMDASGVLLQASMITALKCVTPLQYAEAQLATAEETYARIAADSRDESGGRLQ